MALEAWLIAMRNYVFSVIVGFVAITYGSVPMYKMVHTSLVSTSHHC